MNGASDGARRVALVTGSSRGLGRAIATRLAEEGYSIVLNYRSDEAAGLEAQSDIEALGVPCLLVRADVGDPEGVRALFTRVRAECKRLDVLVNCAGRLHEALFATTPPAKFMEVVNANLGATVLCSHAAIPLMIARRSGAIVNVSSATAAHVPRGLSAYAASKAAINALTRGLARELASFNIRVNAVAPTWVDTEMVAGIEANPQASERIKRLPLGRIARAAEVAAVVAALVRDDMTYLLGQTITIDGGGAQ